MTTRLKLHRDPPDSTAFSGGPEPLYKFPVVGAKGFGRSAATVVRRASRQRLVAAKVHEVPVEQCFEGSACAVLNGGNDPDCAGRIVTSGQLVREIENTLDRMQGRLSDFRDHIDRAFRFPDLSGNEDLPPAA